MMGVVPLTLYQHRVVLKTDSKWLFSLLCAWSCYWYRWCNSRLLSLLSTQLSGVDYHFTFTSTPATVLCYINATFLSLKIYETCSFWCDLTKNICCLTSQQKLSIWRKVYFGTFFLGFERICYFTLIRTQIPVK